MSHLFGEGQGVCAALMVDGDEAFLNVNVRGAIFPHGPQLHQMALWGQLLCTSIHVLSQQYNAQKRLLCCFGLYCQQNRRCIVKAGSTGTGCTHRQE